MYWLSSTHSWLWINGVEYSDEVKSISMVILYKLCFCQLESKVKTSRTCGLVFNCTRQQRKHMGMPQSLDCWWLDHQRSPFLASPCAFAIGGRKFFLNLFRPARWTTLNVILRVMPCGLRVHMFNKAFSAVMGRCCLTLFLKKKTSLLVRYPRISYISSYIRGNIVIHF